MDGGAWKAAVHGVVEGRTRLSDFTFTFHFHALEKEMQPTPVFLPGESQGRGTLWAAVYWVAQSRTRLSDLAAAAAARTCVLITVSSGWLKNAEAFASASDSHTGAAASREKVTPC